MQSRFTRSVFLTGPTHPYSPSSEYDYGSDSEYSDSDTLAMDSSASAPEVSEARVFDLVSNKFLIQVHRSLIKLVI